MPVFLPTESSYEPTTPKATDLLQRLSHGWKVSEKNAAARKEEERIERIVKIAIEKTDEKWEKRFVALENEIKKLSEMSELALGRKTDAPSEKIEELEVEKKSTFSVSPAFFTPQVALNGGCAEPEKGTSLEF